MKKLLLLLLFVTYGAQAQTYKVNNLAVAGTSTFASRPVFNGNTPYDTGNLTIANYLTTVSAASTYLTTAGATSTYLPISTAASTYLSQSSAASTYVPLTSIGTMAAQSASNIAITGGSISGVTVGGSLTGTLPNPTLASGVAASNIGSLSGDLSGTLPSPIVAKSNGHSIAWIAAQSAVPASVTGTTSATTLASVTIPAGAMSTSGALRITTLWTMPFNTDSKTMQVSLGGTNFMNVVQTASATSIQMQTIIRNRGSASSQVSFYAGSSTAYGTSGNANTTGAINTAIAQTLAIVGQLGTSTDTLTLESYTIEVLNP